MKMRMLHAWVSVVVLAGSLSCTAQDKGSWRPASDTTYSMTGEITIAETNMAINVTKVPVAPVRKLTPAEVSAVFDADTNAGIGGKLYRVHVPPGVYMSGGSLLCGKEVIRWMATYVLGRNLRVAFFSGEDMPVFTFDAISNSTALCGTYAYMR